MKVIAVAIRDVPGNQFFEVDNWSWEKGALVLTRFDAVGPVAVFPFESLLMAWDHSSSAPLSPEEADKKAEEIKASKPKKPVNTELLSRTRPGDDITTG